MSSGHLDAALLAEYDEGLLAAQQAVLVQEHLTGCERCSDTLERLAEVRAQVGAAPAELPIPAAVAARIDRALAAERADLTPAQPQHLATVRPFRRRLPRLLAAAAAVSAVALGGYVIGTMPGGGDSEGSATSAQEEATAGDESGDGDALSAVPPQLERNALTEQIRDVVADDRVAPDNLDGSPQLAEECGGALARELGRELIGVTPTDLGDTGAVLVVVEADGADRAQGFVLPTCGAVAAEALAVLTVTVE